MDKLIVSDLIWPAGVGRNGSPLMDRDRTRLRASIADVAKAIDAFESVTGFPASNITVSFDKGARAPAIGDHGAAVWFDWGEAQRCVSCDLYSSAAANLRAIAELLRGCIAEHGRGAAAAVQAALAHYTPGPRATLLKPSQTHWSQVLGVEPDASPRQLTAAFRRRALDVHPDKGGSRREWDGLADAFAQAQLHAAPQSLVGHWDLTDPIEDTTFWSDLFNRPADAKPSDEENG